MYGLALRILGESPSAEEILFEVYLQVWRTAGNFDPNRGKVTAWLVSMTPAGRLMRFVRERHAAVNLPNQLIRSPIFQIGAAGLKGIAFKNLETSDS